METAGCEIVRPIDTTSSVPMVARRYTADREAKQPSVDPYRPVPRRRAKAPPATLPQIAKALATLRGAGLEVDHIAGMNTGPPYHGPNDPMGGEPVIYEPGEVLVSTERKAVQRRALEVVAELKEAVEHPCQVPNGKLYQRPWHPGAYADCTPVRDGVFAVPPYGSVYNSPYAALKSPYPLIGVNGIHTLTIPKEVQDPPAMKHLPSIRAREESLLSMIDDTTPIDKVGLTAAMTYAIRPLCQLTGCDLSAIPPNRIEIVNYKIGAGHQLTFTDDMTMAQLREAAQYAIAQVLDYTPPPPQAARP
jgi:hypothetical protein